MRNVVARAKEILEGQGAKQAGASTPSPGASTPSPGLQAPVPAVACGPPSSGSSSFQDAPAKPKMPDSSTDADVDIRTLMRSVISYVKYHFKQHLRGNPSYFSGFSDVELHEHVPLAIRDAQGSDTELLSYKAPWSTELAAMSLRTTDKYEAGGNIFWINPFPASGDDEAVAGDLNSWAFVNSMADVFRDSGGASTPSKGTVAKEKRLTFTVVFSVWAPNLDFYDGRATFPGTMKLVAGHVAIWGWYVAAYEALEAGQTELLALLWQAALTATIQANVVKERSSLAAISIGLSNIFFVNAMVLADSFPAFARKLMLALSVGSGDTVAKRLEKCKAIGLRYNGTQVHRNLLLAAIKYVEVVDQDTHAELMKLERQFGKDVLTSKWNNLSRLLQLCGKEIEVACKMWNDAKPSHLISLVLQYLSWALQHQAISPSTVTVEWLDKTRDGTPGAVFQVLAKNQMVKHCERLVGELPPGTRTKTNLESVIAKFQGHASYNIAFSTASTRGDDGPDGGEGSTPEEGGATECEDPFDVFRRTLCKTGAAMLDFLFDWFAGDLDKDISELLKKHSGSAIGLLPWEDLAGDAGTAWRDLSRQLGVHRSAVSLGDGEPRETNRSLKRTLTEEGADDEDARSKEIRAERIEAWKNAQQGRKKYAVVSHADVKNMQDVQKWFERQKAHQFLGKAAESHRVFVFTSDTFGKEGAEPWKVTSDTKDMNMMLEFISRQTGPCDVLLTFDGRNGADRAAMADAMANTRNLCELWVAYKSTKRLGRRVAWASDGKEIGWLSLPVPRTSLTIKERGEDTAEWGESTHDTVYSGVAPVPWDGLPMISAADKARVLGVRVSGSTPGQSEVPVPPSKIFDTDRGMPLYWAERKPVTFWEDILWAIDARQVVDLSPGSGSVGRACLRAGIQYVALCRTDSHAVWVGNVLDREACELTVTNNTPLFEQDLASMLQKHFKEVLEQQKQQGDAEDKEPDEEDSV